MKLRNKKTGEICELGHIRQAWREEKDGGMGYMLLKADDNNGIIYNSLAEMMEEWEDYIPKEPLIKDEKIRKAVRAWADVNDYKKCLVRVYDYDRMGVCFREGVTSFVSYDTQLGITFFCVDLNIKTETVYTIAELCGEEEE